MDLASAFGLGLATALATGFGVLPVYLWRTSERSLGLLWGLSAGTMASISVLDLLLPGARRPVYLGVGATAGVLLVLGAAAWLHRGEDAHRGGHAPVGHPAVSTLSLLVVLVFTVHSAPEGVGIGAALREGTSLGLLVVLAIAVHNVPEGTAVAVGLEADGVGPWRAFWTAVATSLPQPVLAPLVFLVAVGPWLEAGMGFAGGAMLGLVVREVVPEGLERDRAAFVLGGLAGMAGGVAVNLLINVPGGL